MIGRQVERVRSVWNRRRYRAAMLRAIEAAREPSDIWGEASRTDGLRAIRALEQLSRRPFDPFSPVLVAVVRGSGPKQRRTRTVAR